MAHPTMFAGPMHMAYSAVLTVFDALLFTSCLLGPTSLPLPSSLISSNPTFTSTHLSSSLPTISLLSYSLKPANRILLSLLSLFQSYLSIIQLQQVFILQFQASFGVLF
ncbi:hypothetical protein IFM46972_06703 [Aspergillus udagawae]|uniref:Uncharacterized protein n=1 Tax=Aspergillus udagawae TaxID=91492 RepID=A0A8H3NYL9_9EURO|nr:hypothetical protein IFM46972_06703 [Aspergillus udagawae]